MNMLHCVSAGDAAFLANDIRVKKGLDGLGCLGDMGWYCVRASLWAYNFEKPVSVSAHAGALFLCASYSLYFAVIAMFGLSGSHNFLPLPCSNVVPFLASFLGMPDSDVGAVDCFC